VAFPVIEGGVPAESSTPTAGTSHVITLPASIAATDGILICTAVGSVAGSFNALTDWTEVLDENLVIGLKILCYQGTGVPGAPTFTSSGNIRTASLAFRISNTDRSTLPQIGTTSSGTSATPDPPASATPTGGIALDYLFLAFFSKAGEEADDDTWANTPPTNYAPNPPWQKACGVAGTNLAGMIAAASRDLNTGAADNPGTFGVDVSAAWRAQTIIIHPAAPVAAAPPVHPLRQPRIPA
jgi:hypothetical protein